MPIEPQTPAESATPTPDIIIDHDGGITRIAITRPERRNALGVDAVQALSRAIQDADADPNTRVVVVTGAGRARRCAAGPYRAQELTNRALSGSAFDCAIRAQRANRIVRYRGLRRGVTTVVGRRKPSFR
ncbi:enoyl-CoA hydratase/isomerase family protein [Rhodococcus wratislaviensis]|uniref:enoyl-CoA hydratase/isomerase family protein n=1 Tax=Rhodococcus wratislaviensis TaxID=44752 RepID=UPI0036642AE2